MRLAYSFFFIALILLGCKTKKEVSSSNEIAKTEVSQPEEVSPVEENKMVIAPMGYPENSLAGIRRTYCFGTCPVYKMYLLDNFTLVYEGEKNVEKIGKFTAKSSQEEYDQIIAFAKEVNYFEMDEAYVAEVSDLPTTYTTLVKGKERKTIVNLFMGPDELTEFESYFDSLFKNKDWQPAN